MGEGRPPPALFLIPPLRIRRPAEKKSSFPPRSGGKVGAAAKRRHAPGRGVQKFRRLPIRPFRLRRKCPPAAATGATFPSLREGKEHRKSGSCRATEGRSAISP